MNAPTPQEVENALEKATLPQYRHIVSTRVVFDQNDDASVYAFVNGKGGIDIRLGEWDVSVVSLEAAECGRLRSWKIGDVGRLGRDDTELLLTNIDGGMVPDAEQRSEMREAGRQRQREEEARGRQEREERRLVIEARGKVEAEEQARLSQERKARREEAEQREREKAAAIAAEQQERLRQEYPKAERERDTILCRLRSYEDNLRKLRAELRTLLLHSTSLSLNSMAVSQGNSYIYELNSAVDRMSSLTRHLETASGHDLIDCVNRQRGWLSDYDPEAELFARANDYVRETAELVETRRRERREQEEAIGRERLKREEAERRERSKQNEATVIETALTAVAFPIILVAGAFNALFGASNTKTNTNRKSDAGPPCPKCGKLLRTSKAKYCRHCKHSCEPFEG